MIGLVQVSVIMALLSVMACGATSAPPAAPDAPVIRIEAEPQAESPPARDQGRVIVMLGDSLTSGFGLASADALPDQLEARLQAGGLEVEIINAGVSGDTSANGLARYDWSVSSADPEMIIVALGANDYLLGLSAEATRVNLAAIIERAQADRLQVILAGVEPRSDAPAGSRDAAFAAIYPALAETYNVPLYPALLRGVRGNPELLQRDGLHPTRQGVDLIADQFSDFLTPRLKLGE